MRLQPIRTLFAAAAVALAYCLFTGPAAAASTGAQQGHIYALVVGADSYQHEPHLRGALNDADLIASALHEVGADVHTLRDAEVTRDAIFSGLKDLIARAHSGDWIVFTYSGHGGQEPVQGDVVDTFILPGYADTNPENAQRIRNHEFHALLETVPKDVNVIFLADSCHSGSMVRSWDPRAAAATQRGLTYGPIVDDALVQDREAADTRAPFSLPNVVYIGAAADNQNAPEIAFDGQYHGAASWYFARALRGEAAEGSDGATTVVALNKFVVLGVGATAESRQTPRVEFREGREHDVLPFAKRAGGGSSGDGLGETLSVAVTNGDAHLLSGIEGVRVAESAAAANYVWDAQAGTVVSNRLGDLVAGSVRSPRTFSGVVDKWRALPAVRALMVKRPLANLAITPGPPGTRYTEGTHVVITIPGTTDPHLRYLTAFDLTSTGVAQLLVPNPSGGGETGPLPGDTTFPEEDLVRAPFGADHVIAIWTAQRPDRLRAALAAPACTIGPLDIAQLLNRIAQGDDYALGIASLYTAPAPGSAETGAQAQSDCGG